MTELKSIESHANGARSTEFQSVLTRLRTTKGSPFALEVMAEAADTIDRLTGDVEELLVEVRRLSRRPTVLDVAVAIQNHTHPRKSADGWQVFGSAQAARAARDLFPAVEDSR